MRGFKVFAVGLSAIVALTFAACDEKPTEPENQVAGELQASLGMICDPIGNRVEAPCLGKNVLAATNAVSCANMALAEYQHLIPLDEVIEAMDKVGKAMPHEHCCTGLGGLAATPSERKIEAALEDSPAPVEQR